MKELVLFVTLAAFGAACSGGGQVVKEAPKPVPVKVEKQELSPERQRYADCYAELACRVNLDYDPMDDYATIHEPVAQLKMMVENQDNRIKYYRPILKRHGYASEKEFLEKDQFFKEAIPQWWEKQQGQLLDLVSDCKKK